MAHGLSKPEWRTWRDGNAVDLELYDAARGLFEARLALGFRLRLGLGIRLRLGLRLGLGLGLGLGALTRTLTLTLTLTRRGCAPPRCRCPRCPWSSRRTRWSSSFGSAASSPPRAATATAGWG